MSCCCIEDSAGSIGGVRPSEETGGGGSAAEFERICRRRARGLSSIVSEATDVLTSGSSFELRSVESTPAEPARQESPVVDETRVGAAEEGAEEEGVAVPAVARADGKSLATRMDERDEDAKGIQRKRQTAAGFRAPPSFEAASWCGWDTWTLQHPVKSVLVGDFLQSLLFFLLRGARCGTPPQPRLPPRGIGTRPSRTSFSRLVRRP